MRVSSWACPPARLSLVHAGLLCAVYPKPLLTRHPCKQASATTNYIYVAQGDELAECNYVESNN